MKAAPHESGLYECRVLHERFTPKHHRFQYRLFYFAIDLDELPTLHQDLALFSLNRSNVFSFRESDFLPLGEALHQPTKANVAPATPSKTEPPERADALASLKRRVRAFCASQGADYGENGRVLLVTLPRLLGYQFNPVSFYFCFDASGELAGAVAEVTNTFREVKPYFIPAKKDTNGVLTLRLRTPKHFYVSPFSKLGMEFDFTLHEPGRKLAVRIDDHEAGELILHTTLSGIRIPLTNTALCWFLVKYPLLTLRIMLLIHWQAFRLWLKKVPHFSKAADSADQRDLYRPHSSISRTQSP